MDKLENKQILAARTQPRFDVESATEVYWNDMAMSKTPFSVALKIKKCNGTCSF